MVKATRASALVLLLTYSAHAGVMQNDAPAPPPPAAGGATQQQADGVTPDGAQGDVENGVTDILPEAVLDVLTGVLAIL